MTRATAGSGKAQAQAGNGANGLEAELERRLIALARQNTSVDTALVIEAVESIMASADGDIQAVNLKLYSEIEALARYIQTAKSEIAALRPDEIRDRHLPAATDELEAIVGATEQATNTILEAMEQIETIGEDLDGEVSGQITDAVTKVYEACSFQDITGQRITKVVTALQQIESKVVALLEAFGEEVQAERERRDIAPEPEPEMSQEEADRKLMNGPALPDESVNQDDIDALLASFDR